MSKPVEAPTSHETNARTAARSTLPRSSDVGINVFIPESYRLLMAEDVEKGAGMLLLEELARKDSNGLPAIDRDRAPLLAIIWHESVMARLNALTRRWNSAIRDLEQPSLFD
jgi:hypothetical protein